MASGKVILNDDRPLFRQIIFTSKTALSLGSGVAKSVKKAACNFFVPDGYVPFSITRANGGENTVSMTRAGTYSLDDGVIATDAIMTVLNQTNSTKSVTPSFTMAFIRSDCLDISKTKRILKFVFDEYDNKSTSIYFYRNNSSLRSLTSHTPYWVEPGTTIRLYSLQNSTPSNIFINTTNFDVVVTYGNDSSVNLHEVTMSSSGYTYKNMEFIMPDHDVTITLTAK